LSEIKGYEVFRVDRRVSFLKKAGTPDSLLKAWIGHSPGNQSRGNDNWGNDITALYDKSAEDQEWRRTVGNRVGIGFELPDLKSGDPPSVVSTPSSAEAAPEAESTKPPYVAQPDDLDSFFYQQEA
jgi:hypothetical protein